MTSRAATVALSLQPEPAEPEVGSREEVGMRISPEVSLFVGGLVLTAALFAVFIPFMARIWKQDAPTRTRPPRKGGGAS